MTSPLFRLGVPGEDVHAVALYPGCKDCSIPPCVILYRIPPAEGEHFSDLHKLPVAPWNPTFGWGELWVPSAKAQWPAFLKRIGEASHAE